MKNAVTELDQTIAALPTPRRPLPQPERIRTPEEEQTIAAARLALGRVLAQVCVREGREAALHDYNAQEQLAMIVTELGLPTDTVGEIAQEIMDGEVTL